MYCLRDREIMKKNPSKNLKAAKTQLKKEVLEAIETKDIEADRGESVKKWYEPGDSFWREITKAQRLAQIAEKIGRGRVIAFVHMPDKWREYSQKKFQESVIDQLAGTLNWFEIEEQKNLDPDARRIIDLLNSSTLWGSNKIDVAEWTIKSGPTPLDLKALMAKACKPKQVFTSTHSPSEACFNGIAVDDFDSTIHFALRQSD